MKPDESLDDLPTIEPDLLAPDCPEALRETWLGLLGTTAGGDEPLAVLTWARAVLAGRREVHVVLGTTIHSVPLLLDDADWRLQNVELVVVCTNRMKHTDTDQLRSVKDELAYAIVMLDTDTDAQIEKAVVEHFRVANEAAG